MFERLLLRLSASAYKEKFVLKGGMLVAAIVGLDNRATMDTDTTIKNLPLTPEAIRGVLESICAIAMKVETILRRGVFNTRPRDFYDAYILATTQKFDQAVFENALQATANHRDTARQIEDVPGILRNIEESPELKTRWERYRKQFTYAAGIEYEQIINVLKTLLGINAIAKREAPVTDK